VPPWGSGEVPAATAGNGGEPPEKRHRILDALTKAWLPFLTALLALVTGTVTLYAKTASDERDDAQASATSLEGQVADLSDRNDQLTEANQDLEDENERLSRRTTATTGPRDDPRDEPQGTTTPTTSGTSSSTPEVLRDTAGTPVEVPADDAIDLDSQEANWGIEGSGQDLRVGYYASSVSATDILEIVEAPPTPDVCDAQTVRSSYLDDSQTVVGQQLCVRTDEGRWAYVRIAAIDTDASTISFDVVVWKLPSDP
jgi:cell division protein FtsB